MIVLKWVFPVFLAVLAIVHLISCWRGDDDLRKPTKVALMPVIALSYLAFARQPSLWVVAGLLFGCLGDVFLLWPLKKKFFVLGTSSFFLGHVCYLIFIYTHYVIRVSWIWIVVVCVIYAAGAAFVYANSRRNIPRALRPLSLTYMLMLCVLSVSLILPLLTAEEETVFKRGRNAAVHAIPKNATTAQYHQATALECLLGWLYLRGDTDRVSTLFDVMMEED